MGGFCKENFVTALERFMFDGFVSKLDLNTVSAHLAF